MASFKKKLIDNVNMLPGGGRTSELLDESQDSEMISSFRGGNDVNTTNRTSASSKNAIFKGTLRSSSLKAALETENDFDDDEDDIPSVSFQ